MARPAVPFPVHRDDPLHPPAEYAALLGGPPVRVRTPDGAEHWMVSRLADVRAVLADPRLSADDTRPNFPNLLPLPAVPGALSFLRMDDPEHARLRRTLTAEFTVRRVNLMRPGIAETVDALLDAMVGQGPPADLVAAFALPLPSLVICRLLGVPYRDHDFFQERSAESLRLDTGGGAAVAAFADLAAYLDRLVADKEREPTDDLLGRVAGRVRAGELGHEEAVAMARLLLLAGHETTANMIGLGTYALLRHPAELARLRADPALVRPAVEELLRYLTIVHRGTQRVAREPVEVGGVTIAAGEGVVVALAAADRDPGAFADPGAFDPSRPPGHHVAFGFGPHQCIGQTLARVEMEIAFARMLERLPGLALACAPEELAFRDSVVYGVHALPVTWSGEGA
ncbi:cytochrome P450 [Actinomadura rifamycini]|uniref:cytochrome P450 n=1 Tax=Actinomadura rifamycini TaxID=31962 RepID=UPI0006883CDB|nr:cytochrome P450 [Actinomadura rifamycini]